MKRANDFINRYDNMGVHRAVYEQRTNAQCKFVLLYVRAFVRNNENIWLRANTQNGILFKSN